MQKCTIFAFFCIFTGEFIFKVYQKVQKCKNVPYLHFRIFPGKFILKFTKSAKYKMRKCTVIAFCILHFEPVSLFTATFAMGALLFGSSELVLSFAKRSPLNRNSFFAICETTIPIPRGCRKLALPTLYEIGPENGALFRIFKMIKTVKMFKIFKILKILKMHRICKVYKT